MVGPKNCSTPTNDSGKRLTAVTYKANGSTVMIPDITKSNCSPSGDIQLNVDSGAIPVEYQQPRYNRNANAGKNKIPVSNVRLVIAEHSMRFFVSA